MVTFRSNSDRKMASRLSLTEVLEAVLDDDSDDFGLSENENSEGEDEGIPDYSRQHYMNPEEVASLGRVVAQESDHDSDSADSIYLTDSEEEAEQLQGNNTMKQLRKTEIVCKIIKLNFPWVCSVPCNVCDVTVCSSCACCAVRLNPSQTSAWCPMVTAQLANMTGDTYCLFVIF